MSAQTYWTLEYSGSELSFESWGLGAAQISVISKQVDTLTFSAPNEDFDADNLFAYDSTVIIRKGRELVSGVYTGGSVFFRGQVTDISRVGDGSRESMHYTVEGPWRYLQRLVFQQQWKTWDNATSQLVTKYTSHVFLGQLLQGGSQTTKQQIEEILNYCIAKGGAFQVGTVGVDSPMTVFETKEVLCAEALSQVLRWHPDAVAWFDYSTSPPTFHVTRRASATTQSLAVGAPPLQSVSIVKRDDRKVDYVRLIYERQDSIDGTSYLITSEDTAGDANKPFGSLQATISLLGFQATYAYGTMVTRAVDISSAAWWKLHTPWLNDSRITSITITSPATSLTAPEQAIYTTEMVSGQWAPWMKFNNGDPVLAKQCTVTARCKVKYVDGLGSNYELERNEEFSTMITATNVPATDSAGVTFRSLQTLSSGDPVPVGLAQSLYDALSVVHYSGDIVLLEDECGDTLTKPLGLGMAINITGSRSEWETMNAQVQQCSLDLDSGLTRVTIGPPGYLIAEDLVELLKVNRTRFSYTAPVIRTNAELDAGGSGVGLGDKLATSDSSSGAPLNAKTIVAQQSGRHVRINTAAEIDPDYASTDNCLLELKNGSSRIKLGIGAASSHFNMQDVSIDSADADGHELRIRETSICVFENGEYVTKKARVIMSEIYE